MVTPTGTEGVPVLPSSIPGTWAFCPQIGSLLVSRWLPGLTHHADIFKTRRKQKGKPVNMAFLSEEQNISQNLCVRFQLEFHL